MTNFIDELNQRRAYHANALAAIDLLIEAERDGDVKPPTRKKAATRPRKRAQSIAPLGRKGMNELIDLFFSSGTAKRLGRKAFRANDVLSLMRAGADPMLKREAVMRMIHSLGYRRLMITEKKRQGVANASTYRLTDDGLRRAGVTSKPKKKAQR